MSNMRQITQLVRLQLRTLITPSDTPMFLFVDISQAFQFYTTKQISKLLYL